MELFEWNWIYLYFKYISIEPNVRSIISLFEKEFLNPSNNFISSFIIGD